MSSILTSTKLLKTIQRRAALTESGAYFSNDDLLEMATEEITLGLMDQIMEARGDYLVYYTDVEMAEDRTSYTIPNRAHGNKLRDVKIIDENENVVAELVQTTLEETGDYNRNAFYMENDCIIINEDLIKTTHLIRMWFYMRPNKLVQAARAGTISQKSTATEVDNLNPLSGALTAISVNATAAVCTDTDHGLSSGDKVIISGSDSTPSIDGTYEVTIIDENSFSVPVATSVSGTTASWSKALDVVVITVPTVPSHFTTAIKYDIVGAESPNKIVHFNIYPNTINLTLKTISFDASEATALVVGDYITKAEETIVPNIPTELHPVVAQRVAVACLESMGDEQNKQSAERQLAKMERAALRIISNRVEGAPKKIKNRFGPLHSSRNRRGW